MFLQIFSLKTPLHFTKNTLTNKKFVKAFGRVYQDVFMVSSTHGVKNQHAPFVFELFCYGFCQL